MGLPRKVGRGRGFPRPVVAPAAGTRVNLRSRSVSGRRVLGRNLTAPRRCRVLRGCALTLFGHNARVTTRHKLVLMSAGCRFNGRGNAVCLVSRVRAPSSDHCFCLRNCRRHFTGNRPRGRLSGRFMHR